VAAFLDTNVLLYSISTATQEELKRDQALVLLDRDDCSAAGVLRAGGVTRPDPLPHEIAAGLVHAWLRFKVQDNTVAILINALEIKAAHGFSFWDSSIIAAARASGCRELYTEDLSHGRIIDGVAIINPFL
jgi:predicted nucleic acid-binding protein